MLMKFTILQFKKMKYSEKHCNFQIAKIKTRVYLQEQSEMLVSYLLANQFSNVSPIFHQFLLLNKIFF